jgi:hypothetical protein
VLLAQLNIAKVMAPIDSPAMASFVARIDDVNDQADKAPGFVWRLTYGDGPGAIKQRIFDDDTLIVNMSVWADAASLFDFVYRNERHRDALRQRREWFAVATEPMVVCWWVPATRMPSVLDAQERLILFREKGPSIDAFAFQKEIPAKFQFPAI